MVVSRAVKGSCCDAEGGKEVIWILCISPILLCMIFRSSPFLVCMST